MEDSRVRKGTFRKNPVGKKGGKGIPKNRRNGQGKSSKCTFRKGSTSYRGGKLIRGGGGKSLRQEKKESGEKAETWKKKKELSVEKVPT